MVINNNMIGIGIGKNLRITPSSVNWATNTGLPYNGVAPDIGAYEFLAPPLTVRGLMRWSNGKIMRIGGKVVRQQ